MSSISPAGSVVTAPVQSVYEKQFASLKQYDTQELLYASFLSVDDALANGNAVLSQAAKLLDSKSYLSSGTDSTSTTPPATTTTPAAPAAPATPARQSITDILKASDDAANAALKAYSNAPAGSSIIDYNA